MVSCVVVRLDAVTEVGDAWAGGDDAVAEVMGLMTVVGSSPCVKRCGGASDSLELDMGERLRSVGGILKAIVVCDMDSAEELLFELITCVSVGGIFC